MESCDAESTHALARVVVGAAGVEGASLCCLTAGGVTDGAHGRRVDLAVVAATGDVGNDP